MGILSLLTPLLLALLWSPVEAVRTVHSAGLIVIKPELHQPTAVVFPEDISTFTLGVHESRLEVNKDGPWMGFLLKDATLEPNRIIVVGVSRHVYMLRVQAPQGKADDLVYITHKAPTEPPVLSAASMLRLLVQGDPLKQSKAVDFPLPAVNDPRLTLTVPRRVALGPFQGLAVTLESQHDQPLYVDYRVGREEGTPPVGVDILTLTSWVWPPKYQPRLVYLAHDAVVADHYVLLPPYGQAMLYAVFEGK